MREREREKLLRKAGEATKETAEKFREREIERMRERKRERVKCFKVFLFNINHLFPLSEVVTITAI